MEISSDWKQHLSKIGSIGGKAKSQRKKDACKLNGAKGGWPKGRKRKALGPVENNSK